jgi:copper chaperone
VKATIKFTSLKWPAVIRLAYTLWGYGKLRILREAPDAIAAWRRPDDGRWVMASATYQVTGMTCEHCVHAVSTELENLEGVTGVAVDLVPGGRSAVTVTSQAPLPAQMVEAALDEAGDYRLAAG